MGFSVDVPTVEKETEAPEEADNNDPFSSNVFDCVSVEEFVSFDDNTTTKQTSVEDWVEEIFGRQEQMFKRMLLILTCTVT